MKIRNLGVLLILVLLASCHKVLEQKPRQLVLGQFYRLTHIGSKHVDAKNAPTIMFKEGGSLAGNGGCNKWFGGYEIADEKFKKLKITPAASSLMMCEKDVINQEVKFLNMLPTMVRYEINNKQQLVLYPGSGELLAFEFIGGK